MEFEWDEHNLRHVFEESPHGLTPTIVRAVSRRRPMLIPNLGRGRSGSHLMIGPDDRNRLWTVVLLDLGSDRWRPITGWQSSTTHQELYEITEDNDDQ